MQNFETQKRQVVCATCNQSLMHRTIFGIEVDAVTQVPLRLCKNCGVIDLEIMQLCRELTIGCTIN